eukprot:250254-Chlamydomonas_euryale.AAC.3
MPDGSVVKQLLFAEGLSRSAPSSRVPVAGWGWYGVVQDRLQWRAFCDSAQPAARSPLSRCGQHRHPLRGSAPCTADSDSQGCCGQYCLHMNASQKSDAVCKGMPGFSTVRVYVSPREDVGGITHMSLKFAVAL